MRLRKLLITLRRLIALIMLVVIGGCIVLLMNFTASNPTGRRYSSASVDLSLSNSGKGVEGETILARDLNLPNNNFAEQRECLCQQSTGVHSTTCRVCTPVNTLTSNYRIPDFITPSLIIDSKNTLRLTPSSRDYEELSDYSLSAQFLERELWVFVRVDTEIAPTFYDLVETTGGGIVKYFSHSGYVDPVDDASRKGLVASSGLIGLIVVAEIRAARRKRRKPVYIRVQSPPTPEPSNPRDPMHKAERKVGDAEAFKQRTASDARHKSDEADSQ